MAFHEFVLADTIVIRRDSIYAVDIAEVEQQRLKVWVDGQPEPYLVTGFAAMELVWSIKPSALEGKRVKWAKRAWSLHNLVAHPVMQLLAYAGLYRWAMWVHDVTVPKPIP